MGHLILTQIFVAVACCRVSYGVEGRGIERDHAKHRDHKYEVACGHGIYDVQYEIIEISALLIDLDEVRLSCSLKSQGVVPQNDEAHDGGAHAEDVSAEYSLTDRPSS